MMTAEDPLEDDPFERHLYKYQDGQCLYAKVWGEDDQVIVSTGTVGDEKSLEEEFLDVLPDDLPEMIETEIAGLLEQGYREPTIEEYSRVEVRCSAGGLSEAQVRRAMSDAMYVLTEYGGWSGNGSPCFAGRSEADGETMLLTYVFSPESAIADLPQWFEHQEALRGLDVSVRAPSGTVTRVWPREDATT
jgi:hypothetical protein